MKAFTRYQYGGPEILKLEDVQLPDPQDHNLLVRIIANSVNPADWHIIRGQPFFARFTVGLFNPTSKIPGTDFAGIVEKVGNGVTGFRVGDRVFGESLAGGVFAEYASVNENSCALMPQGANFSDMACVPIAGLTALQALITHGGLRQGETVLINGASGGVGHFAVQIAKAFGGTVTAICSGKNTGFVKSLGADTILAYDEEDIGQHKGKYDLVIDANGNLTFADYKRMGKRGVMIGFTTMGHMMSVMFKRAFSKFPLAQFTASANTKDLQLLATLIQQGRVKPRIEKIYWYEWLPEAISYIEAMRTKGKVAIIWENRDGLVNYEK